MSKPSVASAEFFANFAPSREMKFSVFSAYSVFSVVLLLLFSATSLSAQSSSEFDEPERTSFAGGGVTLSLGGGWIIEDVRYRMFRLGLQLGGTSSSEKPLETTGEFQLILVPEGGAAFYAAGGVNMIQPNGAYLGPSLGFLIVDDPTPVLGARAGIRPRRSGMRPEFRAEYVIGSNQALMLSVSIGLEVH